MIFFLFSFCEEKKRGARQVETLEREQCTRFCAGWLFSGLSTKSRCYECSAEDEGSISTTACPHEAMLRRYRAILVYVVILISTFYLTGTFFRVSQNNIGNISLLDVNGGPEVAEGNTTDVMVSADVDSNDELRNIAGPDQYEAELEIDKFINEAVNKGDSRSAEDLRKDISKMTDEQIREQLKNIQDQQLEKEKEPHTENLMDDEDNVSGTKIANDHKRRQDAPPDSQSWARYEIERVIPPNYKGNDPTISRENATLFTLCRNSELYEILDSIQQLETRFNGNYHYDWVFLNEEPFSPEFIELTSNMVSGRARYGLIPRKHWSYPPFIDQVRAKEIRESRKWSAITYGSSESYRHMCRFNSLFFYKHPIMEEYDYYWRVEPHVSFACNIIDDPFKFLKENRKKYGFTISMRELPNTIESLWATSKLYFKKLATDVFDAEQTHNLLKFISDDGGESYNYCHYWTNFEIADLSIYRNEIYEGYVQHLDQAGGFFYERWGDAPIHSIIFSLILDMDEIFLFQNISYEHTVAKTCPMNDAFRKEAKCTCNPIQDWTIRSESCCNLKFLEVGSCEKNTDLDKYLNALREKQAADEELKAEQKKLRMETARRQSEARRKKTEERRRNRLQAQKAKKKVRE